MIFNNSSKEIINRLKKENEALKEENNKLTAQLEEAKGDKVLAEKKRNLDKAKEACDKTIAEYKSLVEELKMAKKTYDEQIRDMILAKKHYEKEMAEAVNLYKQVTAR